MLTAEEKARIEEEERKRLAEEHYRAEVRAKLNRPQAVPPASLEPKGNITGKVVGVALMVLVAFSIVGYLSSRVQSNTDSPAVARSEPSPKAIRWTTQRDSIANGQITVRHGGFVYYKIEITSAMSKPVLAGKFSASGGLGNDVAAIVADEENYTNWINGHQARAYWSTPGPETTGDFSMTLSPGTYYFAISNKFSLLTDKDVFLDVSLSYQKPETE